MSNVKYKKGIAIFIAVIAVSALFLISMAISDISYKEQLISYSGRDSKIAFYAADAGTECALFHDLQGGADQQFHFATSTFSDPTPDITCNHVTVTPHTSVSSSAATSTFYFNITDGPKSCAIVQVAKVVTGSSVYTKVESRGYNNTCAGTQANPSPEENIRNLERSFRVTY